MVAACMYGDVFPAHLGDRVRDVGSRRRYLLLAWIDRVVSLDTLRRYDGVQQEYAGVYDAGSRCCAEGNNTSVGCLSSVMNV